MSRMRFVEDMLAGYIEDLRSLSGKPTVHIKGMAMEAVLRRLTEAMKSFVEEGTITEAESQTLWIWFLDHAAEEGLVRPQHDLHSSDATGGIDLVQASPTDSEATPDQQRLLKRLDRMMHAMPQPDERSSLQRVIPLVHQVQADNEITFLVSLECWSHGFSLELAMPYDHDGIDVPVGLKSLVKDSFWEFEASDDVGGVYAGHLGGGSGYSNWMRRSAWFTPPLDPRAKSLTVDATDFNERNLFTAKLDFPTESDSARAS